MLRPFRNPYHPRYAGTMLSRPLPSAEHRILAGSAECPLPSCPASGPAGPAYDGSAPSAFEQGPRPSLSSISTPFRSRGTSGNPANRDPDGVLGGRLCEPEHTAASPRCTESGEHGIHGGPGPLAPRLWGIGGTRPRMSVDHGGACPPEALSGQEIVEGRSGIPNAPLPLQDPGEERQAPCVLRMSEGAGSAAKQLRQGGPCGPADQGGSPASWNGFQAPHSLSPPRSRPPRHSDLANPEQLGDACLRPASA